MKLRELSELRIKIEDIETFKKIVREAVEHECKFKEYGDWLDEEFTDFSDSEGTCFRAVIVCINQSFMDETIYFQHGYKDVSSLTCYDIFYTDITGGGFVINDMVLHQSAIKSIQKLKVVN